MERAIVDLESPILAGKFSKDRWLVARDKKCKGTQPRWIVGKLVNEVITRGAQNQVVKSHQELSIIHLKNSFTIELRGVEGSTIVSEESPVGASAANSVIEKSVWETQNLVRSLDAYAKWVYSTTCDPGSATDFAGAHLDWTSGASSTQPRRWFQSPWELFESPAVRTHRFLCPDNKVQARPRLGTATWAPGLRR